MTEGGVSAAKRSADDLSPRGRDASSGPAASSSESADLPPLDAGATDPDELWDDYFAKRRPQPATVRDLVSKLHEGRRYDHAAAAIRAALRHGQAQPWMYEVLALTLEIQGAPQAQVERALLSQLDFAATDAEGLMLSAAYLTRFGADRPALRLYRQASELAPERPEPYLLGLKLAQRLGDDEALAWAARGVFASAWGDDHESRHREAENAVADRTKALREAGNAGQAETLATALAEAKQVDLHVRLDWGGEGDLDLIVHEPTGSVCSFENQRTPAGGVLTRDGHGPNQENCFEEYVCAAGFPGVYRIELRHAWGDVVGKRAKLTITRHRGTPHESVRQLTLPVEEAGSSVRVTLTAGRRGEFLTIPEEAEPQAAVGRTPLPRLVSRLGGDDEAAARRMRDVLFAQAGGFATGINPTAGVGAVGNQPNITVLSEGVTLSALAVVSPDRRYVRLTLAPAFTAIPNVLTFTFFSPGN